MYVKYQQAILALEYSLFAHIGQFLHNHKLWIDARIALAKYRISILDKQIALGEQSCRTLIIINNNLRNS